MAKTTAKENLTSFGFAYFMESKPATTGNQAHFDEWSAIFEDFKITDIKNKYKSFLEYDFDYSGLKAGYAYKKSFKDITDPEELKKLRSTEQTKRNHIFTVYYQLEKLYFSNYINSNKKYKIYTQSSSFTQTIKNDCIKKLKDIFDLSGSSEILSPVDFFIVDYDKKTIIENEFKDNILNVRSSISILMNYEKNKDKTYEHMIAKYFKSKELIGISHKMPSGKSKNATLKISGNIGKLGKYNLKDVDPYSQMVIALQQKKPSEVEKMIDEVIDIQYNDWDMADHKDSSSWRLFFGFNFKKLDPIFTNSKFGLEVLPSGGGGSYNGKFYIGSKATPWVAGMAPNTVEQFIKKYSQYDNIMKRLASKRLEAFTYVVSKAKDDIKKTSKGKIAIDFLEQKKFLSFKDTKKNVEPYFDEIKRPNLFQEYQKKLIEMIKKEGKFDSSVNNLAKVSNHYISIQMAYFWIFGGRNFKQYLKKKIFFTIFGAITKRGFTTINNNKIIHIAEQKYDKKRENVKVSLTSAPHIVLM